MSDRRTRRRRLPFDDLVDVLDQLEPPYSHSSAEILELAQPSTARRCRVCGCTDDDCTQCVLRTGMPCSWVDEDLCSACVPPDGDNTEQHLVPR